ncbi:MAG: hypothetical protein JOZ96_27470 [Acidobacteria bacterium]|nr:hypothetical protein [Acidobacteriota bacterium]
MSARLTEEDFKRHVGTKFVVRVETPTPLELELSEVKSYNPEASEQLGMERFSLYFQSPGDIMLNQGTFTFDHPEMGELLLFVVPIGRDERGFQYEVVFNYYKNK